MPRAKALRVVRAEVGVSITRMAKDLGYCRDHIGQVMGGRRRASESVASAIADYFEKPVEELFFPVDLDNPNEATAA